MSASSDELMQAAITAASQIQLAQDVNPRVGAVLVDSKNEIVATGFHRGSGTVHAEVDAINKVSDASGLTLYTTLEPCNSTGKQGPCSHAIVAAGIRKVVIGQLDPNKKMAGGLEYLKANGVQVESGILEDECAKLNPSWNFAHKTGRPWVVWKTATSLDGFVSPGAGKQMWITGSEARSDVQKLRATVGAIITGTGTAIVDNPQLTVREINLNQLPLRVVVGKREVPRSSNLFLGEKPALHLKGDIKNVLAQLWEEFGVHRVLVEAGPGLSKSLWQEKLVDEVYWYQAPLVLGSGLPAIGDLGQSVLADGLRFSKTTVNRVGLDVLIHFETN